METPRDQIKLSLATYTHSDTNARRPTNGIKIEPVTLFRNTQQPITTTGKEILKVCDLNEGHITNLKRIRKYFSSIYLYNSY